MYDKHNAHVITYPLHLKHTIKEIFIIHNTIFLISIKVYPLIFTCIWITNCNVIYLIYSYICKILNIIYFFLFSPRLSRVSESVIKFFNSQMAFSHCIRDSWIHISTFWHSMADYDVTFRGHPDSRQFLRYV